MLEGDLIIIRGGGDLATGVVQKFYRTGFCVLCLETDYPTAIRRTVALSEAVYDGAATVEDMNCRRVAGFDEAAHLHRRGLIPLLTDPDGDCIKKLRPAAVIDAILAKHNIGTHRDMAPITIALGPGFEAGRDVDAVIETMRGHNLGRLYLQGSAVPNTGVPGEIGGQSDKRVIHAPVAGVVKPIKEIGDVVHGGEAIMTIEQRFIKAPFTGVLRGLIRPGLHVPAGMKIADIDPRIGTDIHTISDKARCLGGAALEAYLHLRLLLKDAGRQAHDD